MRALEPWVAPPLETFLAESSARLVLLMTSSGQVVAQHGFTRSLDVMAAAAPAEAPRGPVLAENFERDLNASLHALFGR